MCARISASAAASADASRGEAQLVGLDPGDPAEAGDEMAALDGDPVEVEIGKAGIARARRVARGEAGGGARIVAPFGPAEQRQPRPGERVGMAGRVFEQQRDQRVGSEVAGVLGEIGQQQERARIEIAGGRDQRDIGTPGQAGGERGVVAAAHQLPRRGAPIRPIVSSGYRRSRIAARQSRRNRRSCASFVRQTAIRHHASLGSVTSSGAGRRGRMACMAPFVFAAKRPYLSARQSASAARCWRRGGFWGTHP